jgi:hypothetical protein
MNIIFFYTGEPTPIFETQLELIKKHAELGDNIRVLICDGKPKNCFWNPEKLEYVCQLCRSKRANGFNLLKMHQNIEYKYFENIEPSSDYNKISNIDTLKNFHHDNVKIGIGVASRLISLFRDHRFDIYDKHLEVKRELDSTIQIYENLKNHINDFQPQLFYIFNGRASSYLAASYLCKKLNIDFYIFEVAYTPNRYLLRKNTTTHNIAEHHKEMEHLWKTEKNITEKELVSHNYFQKKRYGKSIFKVERFTIDQKLGTLPKNFDPKFTNIAIFNSTIDEYAAVDGWENLIYFPDETQGLKEILESFKKEESYRFYLRVHPNMRTLSRSSSQLFDIENLSKCYTNLFVIWPEDVVDSYELMLSCNKVITFSSTIGIESAYWQKPTILAGHALYENLDCIYRPNSHHELVTLVKNKELKPLDNYDSLKYAFRELNHGIDFKYFKETGFRNNLAIGKFCGILIKPSFTTRINFYLNIAFNKVKSKIKKLNYDF